MPITCFIIILLTFLEKLENLADNDSALVAQNSNYHGFFVFQELLCSQQKCGISWANFKKII